MITYITVSYDQKNTVFCFCDWQWNMLSLNIFDVQVQTTVFFHIWCVLLFFFIIYAWKQVECNQIMIWWLN